MTGAFVTPERPHLQLASGPCTHASTWPPRFSKIELDLDDGGALAMTNARRLGRIRLRNDPSHEPPISKLGFDPLTQMPTVAEFRDRLRRRKAVLKGLLLDQSFAAGVGNWIADEVLYQARLDPRRRVDELSTAEANRLRAKLKSVIELAVRVDADKTRFPKGWLFHHRWGRDGDARTHRGERIEHLSVAGRTTAWVPGVQA
jgi:formamidopyrimidine-DNA glycosylase